MSRRLDHAHGGGLFADPGRPTWLLEGTRCPWCETGVVHKVHDSEPCARPDPSTGRCSTCDAERGGACLLVAEGYATCTECDVPTQVWPDDVVPALEVPHG